MESFLFALNLVIVIGLCKLCLEKDDEEKLVNKEKESEDA